MESKVASFVQKYRDAMIAQANLFPNAAQRKAVFGLMVSAAGGSIAIDYETARTLLHYMAMNGVADLLPALVEVGFDVNKGDTDERTPLHLAVIGNHAETVKVLVEQCGADVHIQDIGVMLPWHCALLIDCDARLVGNISSETRIKAKERILRILAFHTDLSKVKGELSRRILKELKEEPEATISLGKFEVIKLGISALTFLSLQYFAA